MQNWRAASRLIRLINSSLFTSRSTKWRSSFPEKGDKLKFKYGRNPYLQLDKFAELLCLSSVVAPQILLCHDSGTFNNGEKFEHSDYCRATINWNSHLWSIVIAQTAIAFGINGKLALAEASESKDEGIEGGEGFRLVEDDSVVSNEHTMKWRVFTDSGIERFMQGKLDDAEKLFVAAIKEAKEGFGENDAHVASACNNLAELHRIRKFYDKAEPLYLQAIEILEATHSAEDIRVGAALHNLGIFYLLRKKMAEARQCFERALKIKGRILGYNHLDYGDTMYRLGMVLNLEGNIKEAEALILSSIDVLEGAGEGESMICMRRLRYLALIYSRSHRMQEAENVQRKIFHIMEISKGWDSMATVIAAEALAQTLQSCDKLKEAREILERCLEARKSLLPAGHFQIGTNMLQLAKIIIATCNPSNGMSFSEANSNLNIAKTYLDESIRIAGQALVKYQKNKRKPLKDESDKINQEGRAALAVLLQALETNSTLEIKKQQIIDKNLAEKHVFSKEAERELLRCVSAFKQFEGDETVSDTEEVKRNYLSCLKHLSLFSHLTKPLPIDLSRTIHELEAQLNSS